MQETITKKLPKTGKEVVIKQWITGADAEYINEPILNAMELQNLDKPTPNLKGSSITELNHRTIERFVVSVGDKKDNILQEVLSLPEDDTNFVIETIAELRKKK